MSRKAWWYVPIALTCFLPLLVVVGSEEPGSEESSDSGAETSRVTEDAWTDPVEPWVPSTSAATGDSPTVQFASIPTGSEAASAAGEEGVAVETGMPQLDCVIEPYLVVGVGSQVEGILESVSVERSDFVQEGEVLAQLKSDLEQATVEVARARAAMDGELKSKRASLEFGKRRQARTDELFDQNAISLHLQDETETDKVLAELQLERARENKRLNELELRRAIEALKLRTIESPIAGVVVERMMSPGELVDEEPILRVAQIDPLRVEVIVPAALFGSIEKGMKGAVMPEAPRDGRYEATVTIVDRVIDAASGTFGVQLELPNPDYHLPGGLQCHVRFLDAEGRPARAKSHPAGGRPAAKETAEASDSAS